MESDPKSSARRTDWLVVIGLMLVAAGVRWVGLDFALPEAAHPDEPGVMLPAQQWLATGSFDVPMWKYPPLMSQLVALVIGAGEGVGLCESPCPGPTVLWLGRHISLASGVASVAFVYAAVRAVGGAPWSAALGAGLLALNPLSMESSRYLKPDVMASAFVALALWGAAEVAGDGRRRGYVLAALGIGFAGASKYNAALVAVPVVVAHFAYARLRWRLHLPLLGAGLGAILIFAASLVLPWTGPEAVLDGIRHEWLHYREGHGGFTTQHIVADALGFLFRFGWTGPTMVLLIVGMGMISRVPGPSRRLVGALSVYVIAYFVLLEAQAVFFARVLIPVLPAFAVATGLAAAQWEVFASPRVSSAHARLLPLAMAVVALLLPARSAVRQVQAMSRPDTRDDALAWMVDHLPSSAYVAVVPGMFKVPAVNGRWRFSVASLRSPQALRRQGFTHLVVSVSAFDRYVRSPTRFPERARDFEAWHTAIGDELELLRRFENPRLPGADEFGSMASTLHQPTIEVYAF